MSKKVTIRDIARMAGVSYSTVSRALSDNLGVSKAKREEIIAISKQMGYQTNYLARTLAGKESRLIGIIVGSIQSPFLSDMVYHIEMYAKSLGFNVVLCNSSYDYEEEIQAFELLTEHQVDGILICPAGEHSYRHLKKRIASTPTVFLGEDLKNLRENYVCVDNFRGAKIGTEYLISLGHQKILYFACRKGNIPHQIRYQGYASVCLQNNLIPKQYASPRLGSSLENGYMLANQLFNDGFDSTAIFAAADASALGLIRAADEHGIRIPQDISLIGFDDILFSSLPRIDLTTIRQPRKLMAQAAIDVLIEHYENSESGFAHKAFKPELILRGSCAAI